MVGSGDLPQDDQVVLLRRELEDARVLLEQTQRLAGIGHWRADFETGELTWSPMIYELFGLDPDHDRPDHDVFYSAVHPEDLPEVLAAQEHSTVTGVYDVVHRIVRPGGEVRVVHELARSVTNDAGDLCALVGTVQDVTTRERDRQALAEREALLHRVLAATNDGWWDNDPVAGTAFHSERWWRIHGYAPGELTSDAETWRRLTDARDLPRADAELASAVAIRAPTFTVSCRVRHRDGHEVPVVVRGLIDYDDQGRPVRFSGATTDVTELRKAEATKDAFLATVSHELRTPLTSIGGALELVRTGRVGPVPDGADTLLAVAERNTVRLRRLIDDLLQMERLLADRHPFELAEHALSPLVQLAVEDHRPVADTRNVRLRITTRADAAVVVDRDRLQQVVTNLLSNATRFAPPDSTVEVAVHTEGDRARVEVVDHGPGVPAELGERTFDRFVQADDAGTSNRGGSGLGLSISRELTEQMGGRIGFTSRPGHTRFWLVLPTADAEPPRSSAAPAGPHAATPQARTARRRAHRSQGQDAVT